MAPEGAAAGNAAGGSRSTRRWRVGALAVVILAAVLRLSILGFHGFEPERVSTADSAVYVELARNLLQEGSFVLGSVPETFRTPGYPLLLAVLEALPGSLVPWIVCIQFLLDLMVVAAAVLLGRRWCSPAAGIVAGLIVALDPGHLVAANLLMADVPAAAAVAGGFLLAERGGMARSGLSGLLITAAIALRPVTLLLALPLAVRLVTRGAARHAVVLAVAAALLFPTAWTVRNGLVAGRWSPSTAFELNLGLVTAAKIVSEGEGVPLEEARRRLVERGAVLDPQGMVERNWRVLAAAVAAHPLAALREAALSSAELLLAGERRHALVLLGAEPGAGGGGSIGETLRGRSLGAALAGRSRGELLLVAAQAAFNGGVLLLAGVGAMSLFRSGRRVPLLIAGSCLVLVLTPSLVVASARMRVPVSLFLAILAGAGGDALARRSSEPRSG